MRNKQEGYDQIRKKIGNTVSWSTWRQRRSLLCLFLLVITMSASKLTAVQRASILSAYRGNTLHREWWKWKRLASKLGKNRTQFMTMVRAMAAYSKKQRISKNGQYEFRF